MSELTKKQQDVAILVSRGLSYKEIAVWLGLANQTAAYHKWQIRKVLGARNTTELVVKCVELYDKMDLPPRIEELTNKKYCPRCKHYKSKTVFNKCKPHKDGLASYCKSCDSMLKEISNNKISPSELKLRRAKADKKHCEKIKAARLAKVYQLQ